ncbi:hypothetical protein Taro_024149 [Colocasia esculenta]|uniref:CCHC-type domain-containing protein n=1 Tax=Colocasia esculenta TaxID=4460 RepID=A0A843VDM4_COLES|nr:hypothetical protein [Colocasia esculenta]
MVPGSEKPECVHCGKRHGGDVCWLKERRCLKCGSKDHQIRECPRLKKLVPRGVPATATTKLAAPTKEKVLIGDDIDGITKGVVHVRSRNEIGPAAVELELAARGGR